MREPTPMLSFRHLLTGAIDAFLVEQGLAAPPTATVVAELAIVLSHYREEGDALHPLVFVCERLRALMDRLDARDALVLGEGPESALTAQQAVKTCAPLARGGWSIFIDRDGGRLRYGVFCADDFVLRETPLEILRRTDDPTLRALAVVRVADDVIELSGAVGASRHIYLSSARTDAAAPGTVSRELLGSITRDCPDALRDDVVTFYRRVMLDVLRAAHGTLVAVAPLGTDVRALFRDGVLLPAPVDVGARVAAYRALPGETTQAALQALRTLLRGMTASDGVTVLRTDGAIVGFNVFVPHVPPRDARRDAAPGGARRRTFEALAGMLGRGLDAAYFRSQDGHAECRRASG